MHAYIHLFWTCFLVAGTPRVCSSQWSGLSTKKEVTLQNSCWITGAKGEKKIESHIKGGQSWVWRQQRLIWWWWFVNLYYFFKPLSKFYVHHNSHFSQLALKRIICLQTFLCGIKHHSPLPPPQPVSHCGFFPASPPKTWRALVSDLQRGMLFCI